MVLPHAAEMRLVSCIPNGIESIRIQPKGILILSGAYFEWVVNMELCINSNMYYSIERSHSRMVFTFEKTHLKKYRTFSLLSARGIVLYANLVAYNFHQIRVRIEHSCESISPMVNFQFGSLLRNISAQTFN